MSLKKGIHYILFILSILPFGKAPCQVQAADYVKKSAEFYHSLDSFTVNIRMTAYTGQKSNPKSEIEGTIWKAGNRYKVKYPMVEILDNGKDYINCYMNTQRMYIAASEPGPGLPLALVDIDELLGKASRTEVATENNLTTVTLYFSGNAIYKQIVIHYFLPEYSLKKLEVYYAQPLQYGYFDEGASITRFDMELYGWDMKPVMEPYFFDSSQYYQVTASRTLSGNGKYQSFTIYKNSK